jgi:pimeloyl-ACP methyl ester carboxylesterase
MPATTIVLLPGLDGTGELFRPLLAHLPPALQPIIVRYPGNEQLGYDVLLERVLGALPARERFIILGESFSGPLALMAADTRPAGLEAIVLCATFVRSPLWIRAAWLRHLVRPWAFRLIRGFPG